ncbi:MAG: hypothetical protein EOP56_10170 [Sphingobacteriales bacterium]|nr:MAG: hypothetical protein EOP56_10170 [Sphingobacteriales bacterium]
MSQHYQKYPEHFGKHKPRDKRVFGVGIILLGVFILLRKLNIFHFDWHHFWPVILIAIGLFVGVQKRFRNNAWWILILIGTVHLIPRFTIPGTDTSSSALVLPAALIIGGLLMVFRPRKEHDWKTDMQIVTSAENQLDVDVTFGGRKEIITSKDFRGGRVQVMFGGCELNMIHADSSTQPMVLDVKVSFGGLEMIVPAHWEIQNEIAPTFGSVEDHRMARQPNAGEEKKVLVLRGSCNCGSIEIKSY